MATFISLAQQGSQPDKAHPAGFLASTIALRAHAGRVSLFRLAYNAASPSSVKRVRISAAASPLPRGELPFSVQELRKYIWSASETKLNFFSQPH
jgi:hypothetical protein